MICYLTSFDFPKILDQTCHRFVRTNSVGQRQATLAITPRTTSSQPLLITSLGSLCICLVFVFFVFEFLYLSLYLFEIKFLQTHSCSWADNLHFTIDSMQFIQLVRTYPVNAIHQGFWDPRDEEKRKGRHPYKLSRISPPSVHSFVTFLLKCLP